jgi:bacteriorhodopsin
MTATSMTIAVGVRATTEKDTRRWRLVALDLVTMLVLMAFIAAPVFALVGLAGTAFGAGSGCVVTASVEDLRGEFADVLAPSKRT